MTGAIDELDEDPSFRLLKKYALRFMTEVDDPEAVYHHLEAGEGEAAHEHIDMPRDEAEAELAEFAALAEEIHENNPELIEQLREEYENEHGNPPSP